MVWSRMVTPLIPLIVSCSSPPSEPQKTLTIAALNDFHGALYEFQTKTPNETAGGLPWVSGLLQEWRATTTPLFLLDGGDLFQGSWPVNASKGAAAIEAFNLLGVDASAVGNHEFDYGGSDTGHALRQALMNGGVQAEWAWLSANIIHTEDKMPWAPEGFSGTTVLEKNGVRIGVIGLSTTDTPETTLKKNVADLTFLDVVPTVAKEAAMLRAQNVDLIAVVGHLSGACPKGTAPQQKCTPDGEVGRLLTELPIGTIDVLVTGHSHKQMAFKHGETIVLQSGSKGRWIGRVDLTVHNKEIQWDRTKIWRPIAVTHPPSVPGCNGERFDHAPHTIGEWTVTPDSEAVALIERWEQKTGNLCSPAGCTSTALPRNRNGGSQLGSVVADAMRHAYPNADLALTNAGGLRADVPKGPLNMGHIQSVMPFDNRIVLVSIQGEKLQQLLEIGTSGAHGPLQVSGGTLVMTHQDGIPRDLDQNGAQETWERNRLCAARIDGQPIAPSKQYTIATTDFLLGGGDHLELAFKGSKLLETGPLLRDHLVEWFSAQKPCVSPPKDGLERLQEQDCTPPEHPLK